MRKRFLFPAIFAITVGFVMIGGGCGELPAGDGGPQPEAITMGRVAPNFGNAIFLDSAGGNDVNDGSFGFPVASPQRAANLAKAQGKSVVMAGGNYPPFWLKSDLYCGYNPADWSYDPVGYPSVISGGSSRKFGISVPDGETAKIDSCTIYGGDSTFTWSTGLLVRGAVELFNNMIGGGNGQDKTFGVLAGSPSGCSLTGVNNIILSGSPGNGNATAFVNRRCDVTLVNNTLVNDGGNVHAIGFNAWLAAGQSTLVNNIFDPGNNPSQNWAVATDDSMLTLDSNLMATSATEPDAIVLTHKLGVFTRINDIGDVNNCIVWSDFCLASTNNSSASLVEFLDRQNGDFRLYKNSSAVDAGIDPSSYYAGGEIYEDFSLEGRPFDGVRDIGADEMTRPPADNWADSIWIAGYSGTTDATNLNATKEVDEPSSVGDPTADSSVWFEYVPDVNGSFMIETSGSAVADTAIGVYTGASLATLATEGTNDDISYPSDLQSRATVTVISGISYWVRVDGFDNTQFGDLTVSWVLTPTGGGPPNDNFADAQVLGSLTGSTSGSTLNASKEPSEPTIGGGGGHSVWFDLTPGEDCSLSINTATSAFDTTLGIYTGASVSTLSLVNSNDDCAGSTSCITSEPLTNGVTYHIMVDGSGAADYGDYALAWDCATSGSNDDWANREVISGASGTVYGSNVGATEETGEPIVSGTIGGVSVWYSFTPSGNCTLSVDTAGSTFDTALLVATGAAVDSLIVIGEDDDGLAPQSQITGLGLTGSVEYTIGVNGWYNAEVGDVQLNWACP